MIIVVKLSPSSRRVVASLDKVLYDNYLCLVASNKQLINWELINCEKLGKSATPKQVRIRPKYSATVAFS